MELKQLKSMSIWGMAQTKSLKWSLWDKPS
jgi:hypothetical protein